jgi:MFS transporter, CP family, cyanate transporter
VLPGGWRTSLGCWAGFALVALAAWTPQLRRRKEAEPEPEPTEKPRAPWRSPLAWEVSAFMALSACGFYTMLAWFPSIVQNTGQSEEYAGWMLFVYQIIGVVARASMPLVLSRLTDQRPIAVGGALVAMVGYLGLLVVPDLTLLWALVTGAGAGTLFLLALAFFSLRAADPRASASLSGMGQSIGYLFAAVGPVAVGVLHDATGGWTVPLAVLAALAALHAVAGLRAGRNAHVRV